MNYKFRKISYSAPNIEPLWQYGVEVSEKTISALEQIESWAWTSEEVQDLLNRISSLTGDNYIQYQVEGGHLGIMIDKEGAAFFNLMNKTQEKEDFEWPTEKFVQFLREFKAFLQKNGI